MPSSANINIKNIFSGNIRVLHLDPNIGVDLEASIPHGKIERFHLRGDGESLIIQPPMGADIKDCDLMVKSDVDLAVSHSRTNSNWKIEIAPNDLPFDAPVHAVDVFIGVQRDEAPRDPLSPLETFTLDRDVQASVVNRNRVTESRDSKLSEGTGFNGTSPYERIQLRVSLPELVTNQEFQDKVVERINNIDNIYTVFAVLTSINGSDKVLMDVFGKVMAELKIKPLLPYHKLGQFLTTPLRIVSMRYGSPASVDILGLGKIFEIFRDLIKDLAWRGKHEKEMARLDIRKKEKEIKKDILDNEKATLEIITRKIELLNKMTDLELPEDVRQQLATGLLPELLGFTDNSVTILTESEIKKKSLLAGIKPTI